MIQRKTQNLAYWRQEFEIDDADHEALYEYLADAAEPQSSKTLTLMLVERRCRIEEGRIRNELARGRIYDPKDSYQPGENVVFPAFDFRLANVVSTRAGNNPEHGPFSVITVQFEDTGKENNFAAGLRTPHILNHDGEVVLATEGELLSPREIVEELGDVLIAKTQRHLRSHPDYFVSAGDAWMTADQMVEVNVGHLNLAEAAIEMGGKPLSTADMLAMIELDPGMPEAIRAFSLETALLADERFIQVAQDGQTAWYLRRMLPASAVTVPEALNYSPIAYERNLLDVELLQVEWDINDEWTEGGLLEEVPSMVPSASTHLIFPHLLAGTLPLPPALRAVFPAGVGHAIAVTLIDGRWGARFPAWVAPAGRYVAGLGKWYEQHKLPVGARITVERTNHPHEVVIDFVPQRMKREWVRTIDIVNDQLTFQMQRQQISCDYDDQLLIAINDLTEVNAHRARVQARGVNLDQLVQRLMPELIKLSPQGTAHVKTLYSAVNVVMRTPPGPVFAALVRSRQFTDTGSGFWSL